MADVFVDALIRETGRFFSAREGRKAAGEQTKAAKAEAGAIIASAKQETERAKLARDFAREKLGVEAFTTEQGFAFGRTLLVILPFAALGGLFLIGAGRR